MLKKRIIGSINIKNNWAVQSFNFNNYFPIGNPKYSVKFLNKWGTDEIIINDLDASFKNSPPNYSMINNITKESLIPITYGGGIDNISKMIKILQCGVDKISINQGCINKKDLILEAAKTFGRQCIVISIDIVISNKKALVYDYINKKVFSEDLTTFAKKLVDLGAGELIIRNINHDGMKIGYDIETLKHIVDVIPIPVIASGGYGKPEHIIDCFTYTNVSGCSIGNAMFHIEHSVKLIKAFLINKKMILRDDNEFKYVANYIGKDGRILKNNDKYLENLIYKKVKKVKI